MSFLCWRKVFKASGVTVLTAVAKNSTLPTVSVTVNHFPSLPIARNGHHNQVMALRTVCKGILTNFFGPLPPNFFSPSDRLFNYHHHTPSALYQSAANGCLMCKILAYQLNDNWLPQESKDKKRLTMKRAVIDPEQGFRHWMGSGCCLS